MDCNAVYVIGLDILQLEGQYVTGRNYQFVFLAEKTLRLGNPMYAL
jgi:hypothetical protein